MVLERAGEEGRKGGRRKETRRRGVKNCGGETRRDERERDGMDRTDKTRQRTGQGQDRTGNRPGTAKPNSGTVLLPNEFKRQKGEFAQQFGGYIIPLSLSSQPFFTISGTIKQ
jgi:hypothetical protein